MEVHLLEEQVRMFWSILLWHLAGRGVNCAYVIRTLVLNLSLQLLHLFGTGFWLCVGNHTAKTCVGPNPTELLCEGTQFTGSFPIVFSAYQSYRNLG